MLCTYLWRGSLLPLGCEAPLKPDDAVSQSIRVHWVTTASQPSGSKLPRHRGIQSALRTFAFFIGRVVDLGQIPAEAERLERLHLVLEFQHIRRAGVERAERFEPGEFRVDLEIGHVLILAVLLLELIRVLHTREYAITQAFQGAVIFLTQIHTVGLG